MLENPVVSDGTNHSRHTPFVGCGEVASDNPFSEWFATPENQQERLDPGWVVGFVDGEGCFSSPIFQNPKTQLGWQVQPTFAVVQSESSRDVLEAMIDFFGCGKVYRNRRHDNHREDLLRYCVHRFDDLTTEIVPFFEANPLRTAKQANFEKFVSIVRLMEQRRHLSISGLIEIAQIAETMNHRKPSKFLRILRDHTPANSLFGAEDMVRTSWRHEEVSGND